jgi:hypothetical protein
MGLSCDICVARYNSESMMQITTLCGNFFTHPQSFKEFLRSSLFGAINRENNSCGVVGGDPQRLDLNAD